MGILAAVCPDSLPMFTFIKNWLDRRIVERSAFTEAQWDAAIGALPLIDCLDADEKRRLRELVILFCHRKSFEGAHGLAVTDEMALIIGLQACLPVLELGLGAYDGWTAIIVYPSGFAPEYTYEDEYGVEHHVRDEMSGESWPRGPVLLSWDDVYPAGEGDGYNLVIHEFAHKLDMQNGDANGFPPLHRDMDAAAWSEIFSKSYDDFVCRCDAGIDLGLDCYAAESPAEFFAVMSEVFFEKPALLQRHYPGVYTQLKKYYRQDPVTRPGLKYA